MPLNVGKQANGKTFIGGINDSGNHWALVIVELRPFRRIIYCDTLAWDPPSNLVNVVNNFTSHIPRVAHSPLATSRESLENLIQREKDLKDEKDLEDLK